MLCGAMRLFPLGGGEGEGLASFGVKTLDQGAWFQEVWKTDTLRPCNPLTCPRLCCLGEVSWRLPPNSPQLPILPHLEGVRTLQSHSSPAGAG